MAYFINWTFRKSGTYAKIHGIGQKHLYDNLEIADFKYDNNFLNLNSKIVEYSLNRHEYVQLCLDIVCSV